MKHTNKMIKTAETRGGTHWVNLNNTSETNFVHLRMTSSGPAWTENGDADKPLTRAEAEKLVETLYKSYDQI